MTAFTFATTRTIVNEPGGTARLGELALGLGMTRVLVVSDQGLAAAGLVARATDSLQAAGLEAAVYADVLADPPESVVFDALDAAREHAADGIVGFGGGSSLDVAKLVAFLVEAEQPLAEIYGVGLARGGRLPLIQVPTTAGTGSEVTPIAIITTGGTEKKGVVAPQLLPDLALLDADLTLGLPAHATAATGIDAMVHAIEASTSKIRKNPLSDALARQALRLLAGSIRTAVEDGGNRAARADMLLGAMLAGQAFANAPVAGIHALAYPLGGHFHVPHGLSNSLVMPHVMRFNLPDALDAYAELAPIVVDGIGDGSRQDKAGRLIDGLERLIAELGLETRLGQVGVGGQDIEMLAAAAMKQDRLLVNNPRPIGYRDAVDIYRAAL